MCRELPSRSAALALLALAALAGAGCFQEIDSGASSASAAATLAVPTHTVDTMTPAIPLGPDDDSASTDDPCTASTNDAMNVLRANCAQCHGGGSGQNFGQPPFDYVLDVKTLLTATSETVKDLATGQGMRFLVPGDPDHSRIYVRMFNRTMPPGDMPGLPAGPGRPSVSDISIVRQWISHCLGADAADGTISPPKPDAVAAPAGEADAAAADHPPSKPGDGKGPDASTGSGATDGGASVGPMEVGGGGANDAGAADTGMRRRFDAGAPRAG
jgi:hypothetical protein